MGVVDGVAVTSAEAAQYRAAGYDLASGPFVEMGVGLDTGEAFAGNIGERAVYDFTDIGDTVNTAAWLQGKASAAKSCFLNGWRAVCAPPSVHL